MPDQAGSNIVQQLASATGHSRLAAAVTVAGLAETLSGPGPFTLFAPTDEAFGRIDPAQLDALMQPDRRADLAALLSYHVVPGRITAEALAQQIAAGGGRASLTTVQGGTLTAAMNGTTIELTGMNGGKAYVTAGDMAASNGVIHTINGVLVPST